eukprot:379559_1
MSYQSGSVNDFGEQIQLLYGQFQLKLEEIDDLVNNDIRHSRVGELDTNVNKTKTLINNTFEEIINKLNQRKSILIKELDTVKIEKQKELEAQYNKDIKIQKEMKSIKQELRSIISNKSKSYDMNRKRKELQHILENKWKKKIRTSLNPCIDDPTLTLVSFRGSVAPLKQTINKFGKIDNEDEKTVDNLSNYYKLKDGILNISVVCAQNLMAADSNGFSDPYAEIMINKNKNKKQKTKVIKKTVNPTWDEKFVFHIKDPIHDFIHVNVYDKDKMKKDDIIGELIVPVIMVLKSSGFIERNFTFVENCSTIIPRYLVQLLGCLRLFALTYFLTKFLTTLL